MSKLTEVLLARAGIDQGLDEVFASSAKPKRKHERPKMTPPESSEAITEAIPDEDMPDEQKDSRTVFVGNLSNQVLKNKSSQKALVRHLISFAPMAKVDSVRFRSIAFKNPTSSSSIEEGSSRRKERAAQWRNNGQEAAKTYLKPAEKKKIAFIKKEFHEEADTCHAYVVFAFSEAAKVVIEQANGTVFMDRTIRVDRVGELGGFDIKQTVFVGNLDFAAKEEDLRVFFQGLIGAERGPGENPWVKNVRIIRDKDTQLGKGFAYVLFADRQSVDEVLAMEEGRLRFAKRKLRVSRCRGVREAGPKSKPAPRPLPRQPPPRQPPPAPTHGDPSLGEQIKHLSKEKRKEIKSENSTRIQRRLEKKKTRMKMERAGLIRNRVRNRQSGRKRR